MLMSKCFKESNNGCDECTGKVSFCDCLDLMKEMSSGGNITDEQAKLYQECLDNDVPTGNSAADQKERDRKMSECQ